jgi:hypothetical protein
VNFEVAPINTLQGRVVIPGASTQANGPRLLETIRLQGELRAQVQTEPGKRYFLEYSDSLPGTNWTSLPPLDGDGTVKLLVDPNANKPQRFYRVRVE